MRPERPFSGRGCMGPSLGEEGDWSDHRTKRGNGAITGRRRRPGPSLGGWQVGQSLGEEGDWGQPLGEERDCGKHCIAHRQSGQCPGRGRLRQSLGEEGERSKHCIAHRQSGNAQEEGDWGKHWAKRATGASTTWRTSAAPRDGAHRRQRDSLPLRQRRLEQPRVGLQHADADRD
eukprot:252665-Chlamydomonas_euryale.AAC.1